MVVSKARREYIRIEDEEENTNAATTLSTIEQLNNNCNLPKTPSYLSNVIFFHDNSQPTLPPKYEIV